MFKRFDDIVGIEHVKACRKISAALGRELESPCLHNLWIPDGSKEVPVDRGAPRALLKEALDEIYAVKYSPARVRDSLESKLFGIGSESFVVGSHEFYLSYALVRGKLLCLDLGHFHPTESLADKISAILLFAPGLVFHLSRGVRWDSDHVVVLNDEVLAINRVGAWVIGARAALQGILFALLLPEARLREAEASGDGFRRLALREEARLLPFGAVWDRFCLEAGIPTGRRWLDEIARYERKVLSARGPAAS